jgi:hypothetical protein
MRDERQKELDEALWSMRISEERRQEVAEWLRVRAVLDHAWRETKNVLGAMVSWSNGWTTGGLVVAREGGGVARLSQLSFKQAIRGLVEQVYEIEHETSRLYRQYDLYHERQNGQGV